MKLIYFLDRDGLPYLSHAVNYKFEKSKSRFYTDHDFFKSKCLGGGYSPGFYGATFNNYCIFRSEKFPKDIIILTGKDLSKVEIFIVLFLEKGVFYTVIHDKNAYINVLDGNILGYHIRGYVNNRSCVEIFNDLKNGDKLKFVSHSKYEGTYYFDVINQSDNCVSDRVYCKSYCDRICYSPDSILNEVCASVVEYDISLRSIY